MTFKFGEQDKVEEALQVLTLIRHMVDVGTGAAHPALSLHATVEDILDIVAGTQILRGESTLARGDIIIADSNPNWTILGVGGANEYLKTDGTDVSWGTLVVGDIPAHDLLAATHGDTNPQAVTRGSLVYGNSTPAWDELTIGTANQLVKSDGTDVSWASFDWDDISSAAAADMVHDHSSAGEGGEVPLASLGDYTRGDLIIGGAADWEDLAVGGAGDWLYTDGTDVSWRTMIAADLPAHDLLSANHGDTNAQAVTRGSLVYANATPAWDELTISAAGHALISDGTDVAWDQTPTWTGQHTFSNTLNAAADLSDPTNYHIIIRNPADDTGEMIALGFYTDSGTNDVGAAIGVLRTGANAQSEMRFYTKISDFDATDPVLTMSILNTGIVKTEYGAVINEGSHDSDTRIESNGDVNMFYVDAGNDRIYLGSATGDANRLATESLEIIDGDLLVSYSGQTAHLSSFSYGVAGASNFPAFRGRSARGTRASPTAVQAGDVMGRFGGGGYGSTAFSGTSRAYMQAEASQTWTDANQGADMNFFTTPNNSNTAAQRGMITQDGKFVFGTATSGSDLVHVYHAADDIYMRIETDKVNGEAGIRFINDAQSWRLGINASDLIVLRDITNNTALLNVSPSTGNLGIGMGSGANSLTEWNMSTENLEFVDAGSAGATEQDWIEVEIGGVQGFIRVFAAV